MDNETIYREQIAPLLEQIGEICKAHDMPFIFSVVVGDDGENYLMESIILEVDDQTPIYYQQFHEDVQRMFAATRRLTP